MRVAVRMAAPVLVAAVALVAGCGTAHYRPAAHGRGVGAGDRPGPAGVLGPATITRVKAERLARTLLGRAVVPPGAHLLAGPTPAVVRQPPSWASASPSVGLHRIWTVNQPVSSVYDLVSRHVPAGMRLTGSGRGGTPAGVSEQDVSYRPTRLPTGVDQVSLTMTVARSGAVTVLRADAQVIWYPPRSAAEHIPAGVRVVAVTASYYGSGPAPRTVGKSFTSAALAGQLAAMLNGAHAAIGGVRSCPMERVTYTVAFATSRTTRPYLVATDAGCGTLGITVAGRQQPALQTPAGLDPALSRLIGGPADLPRSARIPPAR